MDLREIAKQYPGVIPRGNSIQLAFTYNGIRCRETLKVTPTKTILESAYGKLQAIKWEIAIGTFDYGSHFPNSKKARELSKTPGAMITIEQALKEWFLQKRKRLQPSSIRDYEQSIWSKLIPGFGKLRLTDLTPSLVNRWIAQQKITNKRINNILSPLRQMLKDAYFDGLIETNPMDRVRNLPINTREPNPFRPEEIEKILNQLQDQERNLIQFAFWTGLRTSELIALRWQDIDFDNNRFYVRIAKVLGKEKSTKTTNGLRTVELQPQAKEALLNQMEYSQQQETVFLDPKTGNPWNNDKPIRQRVWKPALKAASITYRNPYQTRHTFASLMLSRGENPMWVAGQMGHKDWGMIRKIYGRWIS